MALPRPSGCLWVPAHEPMQSTCAMMVVKKKSIIMNAEDLHESEVMLYWVDMRNFDSQTVDMETAVSMYGPAGGFDLDADIYCKAEE